MKGESKIIEGLKKIQTVGGNKKGFRKRQYKIALVARKFYHVVGAPSLRNSKVMIRQNSIPN